MTIPALDVLLVFLFILFHFVKMIRLIFITYFVLHIVILYVYLKQIALEHETSPFF